MSKYSVVSNKSDELIVVRSQDYQTGSASNFNISLQTPIQPDSDESLEVSIHTASIPMTYYIINSTNNTFPINVNYNGTDYAGTITIPIGNPESNPGAGTADLDIQHILATQLQAFFTATLGVLAAGALLITATVGNSTEYTGKMDLTFSVGAIGFPITITLDFDNNESLMRILGFTETAVIDILVAEASTDVVFVSHTTVNCGGLDTLFIRSDISNSLSYETRTSTKSDILGQVVIDTSKFSYALIRPFESVITVKLEIGQSLRKFSLILSDIDGNIVDLNSFNWNCVLRIRHIKPSLRENERIDDSGKIQKEDVMRLRPSLSRYIKK